MKKMMVVAAFLGLGSAAQGASLAEHLPAGALLTLESRNAQGAVERLMGLAGRVAESFDDTGQVTESLSGMQQVLNGSVGREAVVGVFTVSAPHGKFNPEVLAVTRVDELSAEMFGQMVPRKPGARVGNFSFVRQGGQFVGMSGGLFYLSTDKDLLMAYLARLSGKSAPRLLNSPLYTTPTRAMGAQEMSLFMNFSAMAKVARGYLAQVMVPRLLSPLVDALDTLGQYAGGFTTSDQGFTGSGAHLPNPQGKDRPLLDILTHTTDFQVQQIIPADVESVQATACSAESGPYLGRWLTRLDLLDPTGFLTDSQLASHLERAARYLGDECAQVTLAGGLKAGLDATDRLASLKYSVSYRRVRDMQAARAHLPEYAASVNAALHELAQGLLPLLNEGELTRNLPRDIQELAGPLSSGLKEGGLENILKAVSDMKMVYAFRGDYLITAFSDEALQAALAQTPDTLAQNADFQAAGLRMAGSAGWTYQGNLPELSAEDFLKFLPDLPSADEEDLMAEWDLTEEELANMDEDERAFMEEMMALQAERQANMPDQVLGIMTDLFNRYDGQTGQRWKMVTPQGSVMVSRTNVKYRWE